VTSSIVVGNPLYALNRSHSLAAQAIRVEEEMPTWASASHLNQALSPSMKAGGGGGGSVDSGKASSLRSLRKQESDESNGRKCRVLKIKRNASGESDFSELLTPHALVAVQVSMPHSPGASSV